MKKSKPMPVVNVKKYGGKQIAIVGRKIVASGETIAEVIAMAKKRVPSRSLQEIRIFAVPKTLSVVYYARA